MQPCASRSRSSCPSTRPAAAAARCCAASQTRQTAHSSARAAPPRTRWAPAWSAARAPARRATGIEASLTDADRVAGAAGGRVLLGHGSGGKLSRDLVKDIFVTAFANPVLERLDDAAALTPQGRIAFTTDSHVVQPLRFPGGDIGRLAVAGPVNDLATAASASG